MKKLFVLCGLILSSSIFAANPKCGDASYVGAKFCETNGACMDHCSAMSSEFNPIHAALVPSADGGKECGCVPGSSLGGGLNIREEQSDKDSYYR
jgi:hypothetical protein